MHLLEILLRQHSNQGPVSLALGDRNTRDAVKDVAEAFEGGVWGH